MFILFLKIKKSKSIIFLISYIRVLLQSLCMINLFFGQLKFESYSKLKTFFIINYFCILLKKFLGNVI